MAFNDPIADLLTRIRNGLQAEHRFIDISWSKMKEGLAKILKEQGYIQNYIIKKDGTIGTIRVFLKYGEGRKSVIQGIKRVSTPGVRKYRKHNEIKPVFGGMGISIISTSQGLMVGKEARDKNLGGELLCTVW